MAKRMLGGQEGICVGFSFVHLSCLGGRVVLFGSFLLCVFFSFGIFGDAF